MNNEEQFLEIDTTQARQQLELLGYGNTDSIYMRELPRKGEKGHGRNITCTMADLPTTQRVDKALYVVVNGQGHKAENITHGRALMFESDDPELSRNQHETIWQKLGKDKNPTFQVETRHSIHTYLVYSDPLNIKDWCEMQSDGNEFLDTDRKVKDAPRLLRLAGSWHTEVNPETGEVLTPVQCQLINITGKKYDYQDLRSIIPQQQTKKAKPVAAKTTTKPRSILVTNINLSDYVKQAQKQLGMTLYDSILVDDNGRCNCSFHNSKSGNSAWIREYPDGSGYHFNCPTCTDMGNRESINTFEFWLWQKHGPNTPIPTGKDYVNAAKEFCSLAGIEIPDFQPKNQQLTSTQRNPIADSINKELSLDSRLNELLKIDCSTVDLINAAIELTKDIEDPIEELETWIKTTLPATQPRNVERNLSIIGAIDSEYGNKGTKLNLGKLIQAYSPMVEDKYLLTNLKDIESMMKGGAIIANPPKNEKQKAIDVTATVFPKLRFNLLTGKAESNGEELQKIELAYLKPELVADKISKNLAIDSILVNAHANEYHPVRDYLESLENTTTLSDEQWDNLGSYILGNNDQLAQIIFKKALIAAVARIYKPGCYVRMVVVFVGKQGAGKSTVLRLLGGDEFFSDSLGKLDNPKDDYQLLHSYWIHEWGEIDKLNKKSAGDVKAFITKTKDDYRAPYARSPETHKRQCVIFGSCNRRDFLKDSTGNTRFSVIDVGNVNLELLKQWRDSIWATAKARFEAGEQWELTQAEQALSELNNQSFTELDSWHEDIESFLSDSTETSISAILDHLGIEISKKDSLNAKRVRDVLTTLGWQKDKNPSTFQGKRTRVWRSPLTPRTTEEPTSHNPNASCVNVVQTVVSDKTHINQGFQTLDTTCTTKNTKNILFENSVKSLTSLSVADTQTQQQSVQKVEGEVGEKAYKETVSASCVDTSEIHTEQRVQTAQPPLHNPAQPPCTTPKDPIDKTQDKEQRNKEYLDKIISEYGTNRQVTPQDHWKCLISVYSIETHRLRQLGWNFKQYDKLLEKYYTSKKDISVQRLTNEQMVDLIERMRKITTPPQGDYDHD